MNVNDMEKRVFLEPKLSSGTNVLDHHEGALDGLFD
jgi:hypothetical protein